MYARCLLELPKVPRVVDCSEDTKLLLLNTATKTLPQELAPYATDSNLKDYTLELGYEYFTAEEVLRTLLPDHIVVPTGFETVGHIAHLNLKEEQMPFKHLIGEVILDVKII